MDAIDFGSHGGADTTERPGAIERLRVAARDPRNLSQNMGPAFGKISASFASPRETGPSVNGSLTR